MLFSKFIKQLSFSAFALLVVPLMALAQGGEVEGQALAQINMGGTTMNVTATDINVTFTIANVGSVPQSDIRYGTEILKATADGGEVLVDRLVVEETVSVAGGASLFKNAKHPLAGLAPGEYSVWVVAMTTGGVTLGLAEAGKVTVTDSNAVSFLADTCYLTVGDAETKYILSQGVDVAADEELSLTCMVKNHTANKASVSPEFTTHRRTSFGELVNVDYPKTETISVGAGEEKAVTLLLPKAVTPQAYDVVVALNDATSGEVVSTHLGVHYVLRGASATIQTVNFDKTKYLAGEPMSLTMFWTGSADGFADSRSGEGTAIEGDVTAAIAVTGADGVACIDPVTQVVKPGEVKVQAVTKSDCINPAATISLVDADGAALDTRSIEVESPEETIAVMAEGVKDSFKSNPYLFIAFVALALALLAVLVSVFRHKKVDITDTAKLMVLGVVAAGGLLGGAPAAEAAVNWNHTWSNSSGSYLMGVLVNIPSSPTLTFAPGQPIVLTSRVTNLTCANAVVAIHRLTATLQGQTAILSDTSVNSPSAVNGGGTLVAPTTPGNYVIRATILTKARGETSYRDIPITVVAPPVAAVGSFDSVTPATCSVSGWAYDADSSASSIAVHIYRDQSAFAGGTYVGACTANQPRADVNATYGISGNHGFNCALPASYQGTGSHNLYIHAIDTNGGPNNVITGSPKAMSCTPPPSAPDATISGTGCTIPVGGSSCQGTATWNITGATTPNVYNITTASPYQSGASGTNQPITLSYGVTTLDARDGSASIRSVALPAVGCAMGSSWNNSICAATTGSADLDTTGCSIALGNNSCQGNIDSWTITGASNPNVYNDSTSATISNNASGNNVAITLPRGNTIVQARNGTTVLETDVLQAVCDAVAAPYWNGTECTNVPVPAAPQISLDLDREIVRSGETAEITSEITAGYPTECTLQGATAAPIVFTHSGSPATATYTHTTRPLTAAQMIVLSCEPDPAIAGVAGATNEARVNVVPSVQEI